MNNIYVIKDAWKMHKSEVPSLLQVNVTETDV
jgi:hypothetical protein